MILVKPSFEIIDIYREHQAVQLIEMAGRTCYKSEEAITMDSAEKFVKARLGGHESVIEHSAATVKFIVDRGVTHELVRHRLCSFSQESTRYCNYKGGVTFVIPPWYDLQPGEWVRHRDYITLSTYTNNDFSNMRKSYGTNTLQRWLKGRIYNELEYQEEIEEGKTPQQARSVLPNSLKTEIVVTANFREWRHIFTLRCAKTAHPQMREIMIPTLQEFQRRIPVVFDDDVLSKLGEVMDVPG